MLYIYLKSLFSFRFYHRLIFAPGRTVVFFGLFLAVLSVIMCYFASGSYVQKNVPPLLKNFPQVTFEKGVLTAPDKPVDARIPHTDFKITFDASAQMPPTNQTLIQNRTLAWINKNTIYVPSAGALQQKPIPADFSFVTSQENLEKQKDLIASSVRVVLFFFALFAIPFVAFFNFCLAAAVGMMFKVLRRTPVPNKVVFKWAFFLLAPLSALWYVHLWAPIPLFGFAQLILCIIYMQQIFNLTEIQH